ncbi:MAG: flagellar basal body P-ring formation chaperone FlgA [Methylobacter sp.]|nr:flagellar basal body P-ring formation chaperone FlgA [Methylobacter sp.]MDP2097095.1 flagellar basal body P-ring formation chaperone FlgA [Methylobacter sp.]MDP2428033.1 flagellar basal body P-ring formation chaperone FlgA [Methylobacter sp.]MDP3055929.1 flagellar basal body P-ring formation chaperone FlgA [Methylobacter sp.]MDP3363087.1 flagellar basal body P-ring formation chaperone FlgA [Methylobacter sp.]
MIKNTLLIAALALLGPTLSLAEQASQSHTAIAEAVTDYIAQNINLPGEYEATLLPLDSRLNLPQCSEALEAFSANAAIKSGRITVGVRCKTGKKWSIFTSALIKTYQMVVVLAQPAQRGDIISREHLALERRETSNLREDFVTQIEQAENKQATRQLNTGAMLNFKSLTEPKLIKRNDKVMIGTSAAGVSINMSGIAMADGAKGQRIKVKNQNSGRVINATVINPGLVSVD